MGMSVLLIMIRVLLFMGTDVSGQDLVAGGGVTPYGGGGRRHGGYVRVRDPGVFFISLLRSHSFQPFHPSTSTPISSLRMFLYFSGKGFFIAGSSLGGVNGVFERIESLPAKLMAFHNFSLAYSNRMTGWLLALADAPVDKPYGAYGGASSEWLLIDPELRDRFGHRGETIIPGSGDRYESSIHIYCLHFNGGGVKGE